VAQELQSTAKTLSKSQQKVVDIATAKALGKVDLHIEQMIEKAKKAKPLSAAPTPPVVRPTAGALKMVHEKDKKADNQKSKAKSMQTPRANTRQSSGGSLGVSNEEGEGNKDATSKPTTASSIKPMSDPHATNGEIKSHLTKILGHWAVGHIFKGSGSGSGSGYRRKILRREFWKQKRKLQLELGSKQVKLEKSLAEVYARRKLKKRVQVLRSALQAKLQSCLNVPHKVVQQKIAERMTENNIVGGTPAAQNLKLMYEARYRDMKLSRAVVAKADKALSVALENKVLPRMTIAMLPIIKEEQKQKLANLARTRAATVVRRREEAQEFSHLKSVRAEKRADLELKRAEKASDTSGKAKAAAVAAKQEKIVGIVEKHGPTQLRQKLRTAWDKLQAAQLLMKKNGNQAAGKAADAQLQLNKLIQSAAASLPEDIGQEVQRLQMEMAATYSSSTAKQALQKGAVQAVSGSQLSA